MKMNVVFLSQLIILVNLLHNIIFKLRDGYNNRPFAIRVWLIIIQDNILHLIINYLSIKYL